MKAVLAFFLCTFFCYFNLFGEVARPYLLDLVHGGKVDLLSGEYIIQEEDLTVDAIEPIHFFRKYASQTRTPGSFANTYSHLYAVAYFKPTVENYTFEDIGRFDIDLQIADLSGDTFSFHMSSGLYIDEETKERKESFHHLFIKSISVRENGEEVEVVENSNKRKIYRRVSGAKRREGDAAAFSYHLTLEILPNQNQIHYVYNPYRLQELTEIYSSDPTGKTVYGWIRFQNDTKREIVATTSNDQIVAYVREQNPSGGAPLLSKIQRLKGADERFTYYENSSLLKEHHIGSQFVKEFSYYEEETHPIKEIALQIDDALHPLYRLSYDPPILGEKKGQTTVVDANGSKTIYHFDENLRVEKISHYDLRGYLSFEECFLWDDYHPFVLFHGYYNAKGALVRGRGYKYDDFGNVIKESLTGNFTGLTDSNNERREKEYLYSQDNNLLIWEKEDSTETTYTYNEDNYLLAKHTSSGEFSKRSFYFYDERGTLIQIIEDDGFEEDLEDTTRVTERSYKRFTPYEEAPLLGLVHLEEKGYIDLKTIEEIPLQKIEYLYNSSRALTKKLTYSNESELLKEESYTYDPMGRCIKKRAPLLTETFSYDSEGLLTGYKNDLYEESYTYNELKQCVQKVKRSGLLEEVTTYSYDLLGNKIQEISPSGLETRYNYDANGHCTQIRYPKEKSPGYQMEYDLFGNKTLEIDPLNHRTAISYTTDNRPIRITYPDGTEEAYIYNIDGTVASYTDQEGFKTSYKYDSLHRVTLKQRFSQRGELLDEERNNYNSYHLQSTLQKGKRPIYYSYDGAGRCKTKKEGNNLERYSYDSFGYLSSIIKNSLFFTEITYDEEGHPLEKRYITETVEPYFVERFSYDALGNQLEIIHEIESKSCSGKKIYDGFSRVIEKKDPYGLITTFTYARLPHLQITEVDPNGTKTVTLHDKFDRIISIETYDKDDKLLQKEERDYDYLGHLTYQKRLFYNPSKSTEKLYFAYDFAGRVTAKWDHDGKTEYHYTPLGRLETTLLPDYTIITRTYDDYGNLATIVSSDGLISYSYQYYDYDKGYAISCYDYITGRRATRHYNLDGKLILDSLANGISIERSYNNRGQKEALILPNLSRITYAYDKVNLSEITYHKKKESYRHKYREYDLSRNFRREVSILSEEIRRSYDPCNKLARKDAAAFSFAIEKRNSLGEIEHIRERYHESILDRHYSYHPLGYILSETIETPQNPDEVINYPKATLPLPSKPAYDPSTKLTYDSLHRLIKVEVPNKSFTEYSYDGFDRLVKAKTYSASLTSWEPKETYFYLYDDEQEIGKINEAGDILELQVISPINNEPVAIELNQQVYAPLIDLHGNIRALLMKDEKVINYGVARSSAIDTYNYLLSGQEIGITEGLSPWRYGGMRVCP